MFWKLKFKIETEIEHHHKQTPELEVEVVLKDIEITFNSEDIQKLDPTRMMLR